MNSAGERYREKEGLLWRREVKIMPRKPTARGLSNFLKTRSVGGLNQDLSNNIHLRHFILYYFGVILSFVFI